MGRKYIYGEYRWNVHFSRGMARIRRGETNQFKIVTQDAQHIFQRIGDFVERRSHYRSSYGNPLNQYVYYSLRGRRVCPEHLIELKKNDWWDRECSFEGCNYKPEAYAISTGYEDKRSEAIIKLTQSSIYKEGI